MAYTPPYCDRIPFTFTSSGYTPPLCGRVTFDLLAQAKFGTLQAAINVMQPENYINDTYTYVKSCQTYALGYGSGTVQIMKGKCSYGGIRDISASIIGAKPNFVIENLRSSLYAYAASDMSAFLLSLCTTGIGASLKPLHRTSGTIYGNLHAFKSLDFGSVVDGTHFPVDMKAGIIVRQSTYRSFPSSIYGFAVSNLSANLRIVQGTFIPAVIQSIAPINLHAHLKVIELRNLSAYTRGWETGNLTAGIRQIYSESITAKVTGRDDTVGYIKSSIKGYGTLSNYISAAILSMQCRDLGASLRATYLSNLTMYMYAVPYKNLQAFVHSWKTIDVQATIYGYEYPWQLSASIVPSGAGYLLPANIYALQGRQNYTYLPSSVHSWESLLLKATLSSSNAPVLNAYINILGNATNLNSSIYPKVIRLTTVVNISTLSNSNLSAIINSPCFYTNLKNLTASIQPKFKADLSAYVKPIVYNYKPSLLSAKTGYTDSYMEVDCLRLNLTIFPNDFFTLDKYKITVNILDAAGLLSASVNGTLRYGGLNAQVSGVEIKPYTFDNAIRNTETAVNTTYNGIFIDNATIEMSFKSVVNDYYYSTDGEHLWKNDRLSRWVLDVKSFYPVNTALKLKRRLHKATMLYDLKKFVSIDEAMRYAIAHVTEVPQSALSASIFNSGTNNCISGTINPQFIRSDTSSLNSSINPVGNIVIVGLPVLITKV